VLRALGVPDDRVYRPNVTRDPSSPRSQTILTAVARTWESGTTAVDPRRRGRSRISYSTRIRRPFVRRPVLAECGAAITVPPVLPPVTSSHWSAGTDAQDVPTSAGT